MKIHIRTTLSSGATSPLGCYRQQSRLPINVPEHSGLRGNIVEITTDQQYPSFLDVIYALPPPVVRAHFSQSVPYVRNLMKAHWQLDQYFRQPYFLKFLGDEINIGQLVKFKLKLPAGYEKKISPVKILELTCGVLNGRRTVREFYGALKLLQKPVKERTVEDVNKLGVRLVGPVLNLDDFVIIGLMNGLIIPGDISGREPCDIIPAIVVRAVRSGPTPRILPEDWARVGQYVSPQLKDSADAPCETMWAKYSDSVHYVFAIALARYRLRPVEPLTNCRSMAEAFHAFYYWFDVAAHPVADPNLVIDRPGKKWTCTLC